MCKALRAGGWVCGAFLQHACRTFDITAPVKIASESLPATSNEESQHQSESSCIPALPPHLFDKTLDDFEMQLWIQVDCMGVAQLANGDTGLAAPRLELPSDVSAKSS